MKYSREMYYPNPLETGILDANQYQKWLRDQGAPYSVIESFTHKAVEALEKRLVDYKDMLARLENDHSIYP